MDKSSYELVTFQPIWLPYNKESEGLCAAAIQSLELNADGKTGQKNRLLVASFLHAANLVRRKLSREGEGSLPVHLGVSRSAASWSNYPLVGKDVSISFVDRLVEANWIIQVEGSGDRGFVKDKVTEKWTANPTMTMYHLDESSIFENATGAERYIQVGRPLIKVNQAEARGQRQHRKSRKLAKPVLAPQEARKQFGVTYTEAGDRVKALNKFWKMHPLVLIDGNAAACAARVFHDGRIDAGGRFYGLWTGLEGSLRLKSTIDGEQVCQIDIRGSQPTLLSALLGVKLSGISDHGTWHDVYTQITGLWEHGVTVEALIASSADPTLPDPFIRPRQIAKRVIMEIIGTGNVEKASPSSELVEETGVTNDEWDLFKAKLVKAIPALKMLEPRYDEKGDISGYINGPGFLSYHESELILQTIEALHSQGIPAYPVHDCLIVRVQDAAKGVKVLKDTVCQYCFDLNGLKVSVPLTVETSEGHMSDNDLGLHTDELRGQYL